MERTHKRKCSLRDPTIDLSKMRMVLHHLESLKEKLRGIEETEEELQAITDHVLALENILVSGAKKPVRCKFGSQVHVRPVLWDGGPTLERLHDERKQ